MVAIYRARVADYEAMRASLDAELGYPNHDTKTLTSIPPAAEQPQDGQGFVYLVIGSGPIAGMVEAWIGRGVERATHQQLEAASI